MPAQTAQPQGTFAGRPVQEVLQELRSAGAPLVYSSNLVGAELAVEAEPRAHQPLEIAREILAPHGLALEQRNGLYVVVRAPPPAPDGQPAEPAEAPGPGTAEGKGPLELERLSVSASRYVLYSTSQFFIDQRAIHALPDLGEDPLRSAQRLPGAAAGGLSAKSHFRGGEHDETGIYLNGLQLLDPFHIRDYHSIFSSIDARAISGVEAYTGGFPAQYGDHMSGVLALESQRPAEPRHTELGLSVYNTSVLHAGYSADGTWDWLVSARDSNLDVVLDDSLGKPDYFDVFAQLGYAFSGRARLSVNALYANDKVVVITENDPAELERSDSDTENRHLWLRLDNEWLPELASATVVSWSSLDNRRIATMNDPEKMVAQAHDRRDADILGLKQDWQWTAWTGHELRWGFDYREQDAHFRYDGTAEYFGLLAGLPDLENPREHHVRAAPDGHSIALFLSDRWRWSEADAVQFGLRWDRQTYTEPRFDGQLSPRISFLHRAGERTELRMSWGRYHQSQAIQRLQVEDGLDRFFAPQRSDHLIAGIQHRYAGGYRLRAEAFLKRYDRLKPRFENLFDSLALIPELAPDRVRLEPTSAEARGLELSLEYRGNGTLDWWLSYVLSRAADHVDGRSEARSWDQRHALQAGISWSREPWEIGAAVNLHSGWPTTPLTLGFDAEEDEYFPIPGPRNDERLGDFATLDFRISREIDVRTGRLSAYLEVSNATNRDNPCCVDWDIEDDGAVVLDRTLDYWVPIIPAIGLLWEF